MVLLDFSMSPFDKGESLGKYVARSLDIIDRSGLPYQLTPMGTIIEAAVNCFGSVAIAAQCFCRKWLAKTGTSSGISRSAGVWM